MSRDYREEARTVTEHWPQLPIDLATHVGRLLAGGENDDLTQQ